MGKGDQDKKCKPKEPCRSEIIDCREYKIVLSLKRFVKDEAKGRKRFWQEVKALAKACSVKAKDPKKPAKPDVRTVEFLDTRKFDLRCAGFVYRVRGVENKKSFYATLKYRSPEHRLSAAVDLTPKGGDGHECKFELDITPTWRQMYSRSCTLKFDGKKGRPSKPHTMKKLARIFPKGLGPVAGIVGGGKKLQPVRPYTLWENSLEIGCLSFGPKGARVKAKAVLNAWRMCSKKGPLLVEEFSFDFKHRGKECLISPKVERQAARFFQLLQQLPNGYDPSATTKTNFMYGGAKLAPTCQFAGPGGGD
ncbi:MAG: hypothetical protein HQL51_02885 [Magnetococcales bacterium]|nr:hypothetical protein [Magnetococcales bacterium]